MATLEENLAYVEGVVDVSILVPCCFDNPLKEVAADFVADVLAQRKRAIIPATTVLGAYHIVTRYLRTPRLAVKKVLEGILRTRSPVLFSDVTPELAEDALNYSAVYGIESWDGYLIALSRMLGVKEIYTMDEELSKVREVLVTNPFPKGKIEEYHRHLSVKKRNSPARTRDRS